MPRAVIVNEVQIKRTARVMQIEGIFDIPPAERSSERITFDFEFPQSWHVGAIVGASGSGKSTIARHLFNDALVDEWKWGDDNSLIDDFPRSMSATEITELLSSVGFSSPPAWLRPYRVLSNGEKFRAHIARTMAEMPDMAVVDEFTSVVDRTVAQIGSAAVAKAVRRRGTKLVAVSCHRDILDWLQPDWVYDTDTRQYSGRWLHPRPKIELVIRRVTREWWRMFSRHHYLDVDISTSARCFVAFYNGVPVAFNSWIHFPHATVIAKRGHRTVTIPDYQGVGIGNAVSDYCASMVLGVGYRAISTTSHPAMVRSRNRSANWKMKRTPSRTSEKDTKRLGMNRANNRLSAGFEFVGAAMDKTKALKLWNAAPISFIHTSEG